MKNEIYSVVVSRCVVNKKWHIAKEVVVNRLYYVNNGSAVIRNGSKEHVLMAGHIYLFSQCNDIKSISANNFDHTYFDFTSSIIYRPDVFTEIDAQDNSLMGYFSLVNMLIAEKEKYTSVLKGLLESVLEYINITYKPPILKNNIITMAMNCIYEKSSTITTSELAQKLNINECHFIRLFKKHMGTTPMKYIYSYRLADGMQLLDMGKSVAESAELCGYESASAFCVAFKKQYGISPSDYKQKIESQ